MNRRMFCSLLALAACAHAVPDRAPLRGRGSDTPLAATVIAPAEQAAPGSYAAANNAFAIDLWQQVRREPGNLTVAPASISLALGMTWAGARGETAAQMAKVLHTGDDVAAATKSMAGQLAAWNRTDRTAFELRVVDRLFGEKSETFEGEFLALVAERFGAPLEQVDFKGKPEEARARINDWVEDQTKDRIRELLPEGSIESLTRLVLTNAIYFKGDWKHEFDPDATTPAPFHVGGTTAASVPTMHMNGSLRYHADEHMQLVELPYAGDELAMVIMLPRAKQGLAALEDGLDAAALARTFAGMQATQVELALPKLKLEMKESLALAPVLKRMGMPLAFTHAADFTGISETISPLFIDDVYHKTFVEVDEEGTEAAAATAVVMKTESAYVLPEGEPFVVDHPFLFVIRDVKSGAILFLGRVEDPR